MSATLELDPVFRQALKFLHSPTPDAAENIRKSLDEVIKLKHGSSKMLINTLNKKYIAEESKATGSGMIQTAARRSSNKSSDSSSSLITTATSTSTTTVITTDPSGQTQEIPVIITMPETSTTATITTVDDNAMDTQIHNSLFDDLSCVICHRIDFGAKNRLIECTKCTSLYHQECHSPPLKDTDFSNGQESSWCCGNCKVKKFKTSSAGSPSKSIHSSSPTSSSSSNSDVIITGTSSATFGRSSSSSSKKDRDRERDKDKDKDREHSSSSSKSKSSSSRHHSHHHSSSSHHSSKHERSNDKYSEKSSSSSSSSSSKSSVTPNIHIISADKRLQNMKKKAAKTQESKRKK